MLQTAASSVALVHISQFLPPKKGKKTENTFFNNRKGNNIILTETGTLNSSSSIFGFQDKVYKLKKVEFFSTMLYA